MRDSVAGGSGLLVGIVLGAAGATLLAVNTGPDIPVVQRNIVGSPVVEREERTPRLDPQGLNECRAELALAQGLLESCRIEVVGEPVPFPNGLAPRFRPENFEAAVRESLGECPDVDVQLREVDCKEYPCIAWTVRGPEPAGTLRTCQAWQDAFGGPHGSLVFNVPTEERTIRVHGIAPSDHAISPADEVETQNAMKRWELRTAESKSSLFDALGGVELSERERYRRGIDRQQRLLEAELAAGGDGLVEQALLSAWQEKLDALAGEEGGE